ncbi:tetratricopeptide repeat protein [Magnetovibrio sp. PR-2]|uniref:tetratricopeptide repeat protein n=1 Tax=Magnetovibrio sp. PR-2 TaxID=3120356 RepID=UPI002FCDEF40
MNRAERRKQKKLAKKSAQKPLPNPDAAGSPPSAEIQAMVNQGLELQLSGQADEAASVYHRILEIEPNSPDANHLLGTLAMGREDFVEAEALIAKAMEAFPNFPEALSNYALVLRGLGRLTEAPEYLLKSVAMNAEFLDAYFNLGLVYAELEMPLEAIKYYEELLARDPNHPKALINCGVHYKDMGRFDKAGELHQRFIDNDPDNPEGHNNLGADLLLEKRFEEAISEFATAVACDPLCADGLNNMGCALIELERFDEAVTIFNTAINMAPEDPVPYSSLSSMLADQNKFDEAIEILNKSLRIKHDFGDGHLNLGVLKLTRGEWEDGWKHYSWRRAGTTKTLYGRNYPCPLWDGSPFEDQTLFIYPEQGNGDFLQFLRFIPDVAKRGGKIILEVPPAFADLDIDLPEGVETVSTEGAELQINLHASIMDLPWMLGLNSEDQLKAEPYISVPQNVQEQWAERLSGTTGLRVGLVWAGNPNHKRDKHRSIDPKMFAPLSEVEGVTLYSFQVGAMQDQFAEIGEDVVDLSPHFTDYAQTAGALSQMDLLISVDTSVVHLAGAMGIPTWALIAFVPDWRWMFDREDSPWYPKTRIFRQPDFWEWDSVIEHVKAELEKKVAN